MSLVRPLDRYVFTEWLKIFLATALGFPLLLVVIDLTDHLQKYLDQNLPRADIALSYVYWMPQSMFMAMPAAVLFATVFSIGTFTRHSEITAAKASGISFYRIIAPIMLGALLAAGLDLVVAEVVPITDARRSDLLQETKVGVGDAALQLRVRRRVRPRVQGADARRRDGADGQVPDRTKGERAGITRRAHLLAGRDVRAEDEAVVGAGEGRCTSSAIRPPDFTIGFASMTDRRLTEQPRRPDGAAARPAGDAVPRAVAVHHGARAVGGRRQPAARRAGAEDRDPDHLHRHRALRRAACDEHAARRHGVRHWREPRDDDHLSPDDPAHEGDRRKGADHPGPRGLDAERHLRASWDSCCWCACARERARSTARGRSDAADRDLPRRPAHGHQVLSARHPGLHRLLRPGRRARLLPPRHRARPRRSGDVRPGDDPPDAARRRGLDPAHRDRRRVHRRRHRDPDALPALSRACSSRSSGCPCA